jgi:signal transduction histidine kinase
VVADTGPVVDAGEVPRLPRPFQRSGARRTGGDGGLGLGLSIVDAVATAHGARLTVTPRPGSGLDVTVAFPGG